METVHKNEPDVQAFLELPKGRSRVKGLKMYVFEFQVVALNFLRKML